MKKQLFELLDGYVNKLRLETRAQGVFSNNVVEKIVDIYKLHGRTSSSKGRGLMGLRNFSHVSMVRLEIQLQELGCPPLSEHLSVVREYNERRVTQSQVEMALPHIADEPTDRLAADILGALLQALNRKHDDKTVLQVLKITKL